MHPSAQLGFDNHIGPYCLIGPLVKIGNGCHFEAFCSIGSAPEHKAFFEKPGAVDIRNDVMVREYVTINGGTHGTTRLATGCILLRGAHIGHDSVLEPYVTISCNVLVGGHSRLMQCANVGLGAILHQYSIIGSFSMIGMGAVVTKKSRVGPGEKWYGSPAYCKGKNDIGLERQFVTKDFLEKEIERWKMLVGPPQKSPSSSSVGTDLKSQSTS